MRNGLVLVGMAFAVTLAIAVANKLSEQALAVAVGALCGMAASLPVSIAFVIAAHRNWGRPDAVEVPPEPMEPEPPRFPQPSQGDPRWGPQQPIIVIAPPQQGASQYGYAPGQQFYLPPDAPPSGAPRDFRIIGDEPTE